MHRSYWQLEQFKRLNPADSPLGIGLGMRALIGLRANDAASAGASM